MKELTLLSIFLLQLCGTFQLSGQTAGAPDITFGQNGLVLLSTPDSLHYTGSIAPMPNGNIMVAANISDYDLNQTDFWIARLLTDGTPDLEYGDLGHVRIDFNQREDSPLACLLQPDGKLLVCGNSFDDADNAAIVVRLNPDGSLDDSFGQGGVVLYDLGDDEDIFYDMLLLPGGKILLGGSTFDTNNPGYFDLLLVQLNPDGSPDPAFGTGGVATANFTYGPEAILSLAVQSDGKIVAAGGRALATYDIEIARFNPNGSVDTSFANKGVLTVDINGHEESAYDVVVQPDQKIVFCGGTFTNNTTTGTLALMRLLPNGAFDPGFGAAGKVFTNVNSIEFARSLALQPDGKLLLGVESTAITNPASGGLFWVLRYNTDGVLDGAFGMGGKTQSEKFENYTEVSALQLQPDGKILLAGTADDQIAVLRFDNDIVPVRGPGYSNFQVNVSPNPVAAQALVEMELLKPAPLYLELFNESGQLIQVLQPRTDVPAGTYRQTINLGATLPNGLYRMAGRVGNEVFSLPLVKVGSH